MADLAQTSSQATPSVEIELPKLSATEFKVFNSMAETMQYFVSVTYNEYPILTIGRNCSITTSVKPGNCYTQHALAASGPQTCLFESS